MEIEKMSNFDLVAVMRRVMAGEFFEMMSQVQEELSLTDDEVQRLLEADVKLT